MAEAVRKLLVEIGVWGKEHNDRVVVMAHSMGTHVAMDLAASNGPSRISGVCLLAPVSLRRHKGLEPWPVVTSYRRAMDLPVVGDYLLKPLLHEIYINALGFSRKYTPPHECVHALRRVVALDFDRARRAVEVLRENKTPAMVCWAEDDHLLQPKIAEELGRALHGGPRLFFRDGGHFMNKHHADEIVHELLQWDPWSMRE
jgi:pimeloyl-ACP methyl ester carboxylesterase